MKMSFKSQLKTRDNENNEPCIEGYFAVFEQETELFDGWFERVGKEAFNNSLRQNDIRCLFNHDSAIVLGRTKNQTLELRADDYGLWGRVKINAEDREAFNIYQRVKRGDINGCSFGFNPIKEKYEERDNGLHWLLEEADTHEVSICTFPAYPQTEIQARQKDIEHLKGKTMEKEKMELRKRLEAIKC